METTTEGVVKFVKGTWSSDQISWEDVAATLTGGTGDGLMMLIGGLFLALALAFTLIFVAKRYKSNVFAKAEATFGKHAVSNINNNSDNQSNRTTFAFLIMGAASLLIGATLCLVSANHSGAFANNNNGTGNPEIQLSINDIVGTVEENGEVTLSEGALVNYGSEDAIVSSTKLQFADGNSTDCTWTFVSGNTPLYNGKATAEGQEYQLAQTLVVNKNGGQAPVKLKIAGLNADTSKSLIGKNVVKLTYYGTIKASQDYKDKAKTHIDTAAENAKDAIDNSSYLTDEEKTKAKEEIDKYAEDAKNKIDEAETTSDVDKAKEEFSHNCVAELSDITNKHLDIEKQNADNNIDSISGLTDQDKTRYKETVNSIYVEYHEKIAKATSFEEIIQYYTEAVQKFNQTITEANTFGQEKTKGKEAIDDTYDKVIEDIDNKKNITEEEKEKYKKEAEEERKKSKDAVDDSQTKEEIDKAKEDAEKNAKEISDEVDKKENNSKWTVNFEVVKQGASPVPSAQNIKYNGFVVQPAETENPKLVGYKFLGWCKDPECTTFWQFNSDRVGVGITSNDCTQTLYAKWETCKTTITLNAPGATTPGTDKVTGVYGEDLPAIQLPEKQGTSFLGYFDDEGKQYYTAKGVGCKWDKTDETATLTASFGDRYCTVKFESEYGEQSKCTPQSVKINTPATEVILTETGYSFGGWFTDRTYATEKKWDFSTNVTDDMTLYAKWDVQKTDITFDNQGGSAEPQTLRATYGETLPSITPPTKLGYKFDGYYTEEEGAGEKYIASDGTSSGKKWDITDSTKTLYANWSTATYIITFDFNDPSQTGSPETAEAGYQQDLPDCITKLPEKTGYEFKGYFDTKTEGTQYYDKDGKPVEGKKWDKTANSTLYAQWEGKTSTVTLSAPGSSIETQTVDVKFGETIDTSGLEKPEKSGQTFKGYYDGTGSGAIQYINYEMQGFRTWDKEGDVTLYAQWGTIDNIVSFEMNGHGTQVPAQNIASGGKVSEPSVSAEGYKISGWFTNKELTEPKYDFDSPVNNSFILYAKWEEKADPGLTLSETAIPTMEIESTKDITVTTTISGDVTAQAKTTPGESGIVTVTKGENNKFTVKAVSAGKSPYVEFSVAETEDYKSATVKLTINTVTLKSRGNVELTDKAGNTGNNIELNVPYFSDGYFLNVKFENGEDSDKVHWMSSSSNLATSYEEKVEPTNAGWNNQCTLVGITPQTDTTVTYTVTAKIEASDTYAEATATAGVKVTPRDRNVSVVTSGSSELKVELDDSIVLTEEHHGYHLDPNEDNVATWSIAAEYQDMIEMTDASNDDSRVQSNLDAIESGENLVQGNSQTFSEANAGSVTTDDKVFTSSKTIKAKKFGSDGIAKVHISIPKATSNKYKSFGSGTAGSTEYIQGDFVINIQKHTATITMANTLDIDCYSSGTNTFTFTPAQSGDDVNIDTTSVKTYLGGTECSTDVASASATGTTKTVNVATLGKGAELHPVVKFSTLETDRYYKKDLEFTLNIKQNTSRDVAINNGTAVTLFTQNTADTSVVAAPTDSTKALTTDLYDFSMTAGADTIAKLVSPTSKSTTSTAKLKGIAGGTATLHVVLEDTNNNGAETPVPGYKTVEADLTVNVDYWEYSFSGSNATVTKYVGAENETSYVEIPTTVVFSTEMQEAENAEYNVTSIGDGTNSVFSGEKYASKIKVRPENSNLTTINKNAFSETDVTNSKLTAINLSDASALKTISTNSFTDCSGLTTVSFPNGTNALTTIGTSSFKNCISLKTVNLSAASNLKYLNESCFEGCSALTSCNLSGATLLTGINKAAFKNCEKLKTFSYPTTSEKFKTIKEEAFCGCSSLNQPNISFSTITKIEKDAFKDAGFFEGKTGVVYDVTGQYVFGHGSESFTTEAIDFDDKVITVAYAAFENCTSLQSVASKSGNININDYAFKDCINLATFAIKSSEDKASYGTKVFENCNTNSKAVTTGNKSFILAGGSGSATSKLTTSTAGFNNMSFYIYTPMTSSMSITANNYYCLQNSITLDSRLTMAYNSVLDLNGKSLQRNTSSSSNTGQVIYVNGSSATINIVDTSSNEAGMITKGNGAYSSGGGINISSGTLRLYRGNITNNNCEGTTADYSYGGGIFLKGSSSNLYIYGGIINKNNSGRGGGIAILDNAKAYMFDGIIGQQTQASSTSYGNYAESTFSGFVSKYINSGGGVYCWGDDEKAYFYMYGGVIAGNYAAASGGGVLVRDKGNFILDGGTLKLNSCSYEGKDIEVCDGTYTYKSGTPGTVHTK